MIDSFKIYWLSRKDSCRIPHIGGDSFRFFWTNIHPCNPYKHGTRAPGFIFRDPDLSDVSKLKLPVPVISARPRARAQAAMARGRRIDLCDLSSSKLQSVHNLQAQPPAPDYSQPTNQPAPSVLLRLQPATDCFICKMTSIKLTTKT